MVSETAGDSSSKSPSPKKAGDRWLCGEVKEKKEKKKEEKKESNEVRHS